MSLSQFKPGQSGCITTLAASTIRRAVIRSICVKMVLSLCLFGQSKPGWVAGSGSLYTSPAGTRIGIGTSNPQTSLHIQSMSGMKIFSADESAGKIELASELGGWNLLGGNHFIIQDKNTLSNVVHIQDEAPSYTLYITSEGNVGIGTPNPQAKLAVNGAARMREVVVTLDGWPDEVFEADYLLRPLSEVAGFIDAHGHLPDIPPAAEVVANGVAVGDMQARLLRKIEELTLYLIELQGENRLLLQRIETLERR